jgi:hypothetical protein
MGVQQLSLNRFRTWAAQPCPEAPAAMSRACYVWKHASSEAPAQGECRVHHATGYTWTSPVLPHPRCTLRPHTLMPDSKAAGAAPCVSQGSFAAPHGAAAHFQRMIRAEPCSGSCLQHTTLLRGAASHHLLLSHVGLCPSADSPLLLSVMATLLNQHPGRWPTGCQQLHGVHAP